MTYPIQKNGNLSTNIEHSRVSAQLRDFTKQADSLVLEVLEVGCQNAGCGFGHDFSRGMDLKGREN